MSSFFSPQFCKTAQHSTAHTHTLKSHPDQFQERQHKINHDEKKEKNDSLLIAMYFYYFFFLKNKQILG